MKKLSWVMAIVFVLAALVQWSSPARVNAQATNVIAPGGFEFSALAAAADTVLIFKDPTKLLSLAIDSGQVWVVINATAGSSFVAFVWIPLDAGETMSWTTPIKRLTIIGRTTASGKSLWE